MTAGAKSLPGSSDQIRPRKVYWAEKRTLDGGLRPKMGEKLFVAPTVCRLVQPERL
jgi:hypothetical protein